MVFKHFVKFSQEITFECDNVNYRGRCPFTDVPGSFENCISNGKDSIPRVIMEIFICTGINHFIYIIIYIYIYTILIHMGKRLHYYKSDFAIRIDKPVNELSPPTIIHTMSMAEEYTKMNT